MGLSAADCGPFSTDFHYIRKGFRPARLFRLSRPDRREQGLGADERLIDESFGSRELKATPDFI